MESIFANAFMQYGAVGVICLVFIWLIRYLLCNNKKLAEGYKEITKNYSNHVTDNTVAVHDMISEIRGMKDILKEIKRSLERLGN